MFVLAIRIFIILKNDSFLSSRAISNLCHKTTDNGERRTNKGQRTSAEFVNIRDGSNNFKHPTESNARVYK